MDKSYDIPLHDIKPLVDIQEYSMHYLIAAGVVALIVLLASIYLFLRWLRHRKRFNIRKEHLKLFKELDLSDTKNAAYKLTLYGATFKDDSPRHEKAFEELFETLKNYKYKKSVDGFESDTLHFIEIYRGMIDV
jgi:hypothetical protein